VTASAADGRRMWLTLVAMCFALFMIMLDNTVVNVALPTIQRDLQPSLSGLQWTINAYILVFAALILLGGKLGDRFGRRRMFLVGVVVFTGASVACALAQTDTQLIAFRGVQGAGAALMNPLSLSILVAAFPRERLPQAIGIWAGISGLGLALGPLLGGFLVDAVGWSSVFWINVPIGAIALVVTLYAVRESHDPTTRSLDVVGTVIVTLGLLSLTYGVIGSNDHPWVSWPVLGLIALSLGLLSLFVVWEARQEQPMVPLGFFRSRVFSASIVVAVLVGFGLFGSIYMVTLFLQNLQGYSAFEAGARTLPLTMAVLFVAPLAGRLNARVGAGPLMAAGMVLGAVAMLGMTRIDVDTPYAALAPLFLLLGVGLALTMPAMSAAAMGAIDPRKAGVGSGVLNAARQVGGALGIAVLGSVAVAATTASWRERAAEAGGPLAENADRLAPLVGGAQADPIRRLAGEAVWQLAAASWLRGFHVAVLIGGALMVVAVVVVAIGFRGQLRGGGAPRDEAPPPVELGQGRGSPEG
jgi:EmrB/QacA subfamily drug resistance transporter